ncbi:unnamed protein product [Darwinula stevensoni]|uniref:CARD domain-containing protein n=1 Tax=Darwinula stevensoni TaxID=69355 RepID=A0A7R9A1E2_9CRUS|nr:unnamed protein product [Darwinula stevensoni]CAG0886462.1 unnamed protein product [Darwinula stevensoni]
MEGSSPVDLLVDGRTVARIIADHTDDLKFIDHDAVLNGLWREGVLEHDEYEDAIKYSRSEKLRFLERILPKKGDTTFQKFLKCLQENEHQILSNKLYKRYTDLCPDTCNDNRISSTIISGSTSQERQGRLNESSSKNKLHSKLESGTTVDKIHPNTPTFESDYRQCRLCPFMKELYDFRPRGEGYEELRKYVLEDLQVCMGGGKKGSSAEAREDYCQEHYREAGKTHYSLPPDFILRNSEFEYLFNKAMKKRHNTDGENVDLSPVQNAVAAVFNQAKRMCFHSPSLVVADYVFSETFNQDGIFSDALEKVPKDLRKKLFRFINIFRDGGSHGGSGTGKTVVLEEIAKRLAKIDCNVDVVVVNLSGGDLTKHFEEVFQSEENIKVIDGVEQKIPENLEGIMKFLEKNGEGKHVMFDEVPLTLGIQGSLDEKCLSEHWEKISRVKKNVKSLTFAFRPNDPTYTSDIELNKIKIAGVDMVILNVVKRNTRARTALLIIDFLPDHQEVWTVMRDEGTIVEEMISIREKDIQVDEQTLQRMTAVKRFLKGDQFSLAGKMKRQFEDIDGFIHELPKMKVMEDTKNLLAKYEIGIEEGNSRAGKVIMLVGATGAGKSRLINGIVNYSFEVMWEDDFRFKLIEEEDSQYPSQKKWVTAYVLRKQEGFALPYTLTIIDTPGFGNEEGIKADEDIKNQIREFFLDGNIGVDQLDGICYVVPAFQARPTPTHKYIFEAIMALFGRDVKENIFVLTTFSDNQKSPVLEDIKDAGIPYKKSFKFNNSAVFVRKKSRPENDEFENLFWKMSRKNLENFFQILANTNPVNLTLTKEVLKERQHLEIAIQSIQQQIAAGKMIPKLITTAHACLQKLQKIVLMPDPLLVLEWVDLLIKREKIESRPGFIQRIRYLQEARSKAALVYMLERNVDPFEEYMKDSTRNS